MFLAGLLLVWSKGIAPVISAKGLEVSEMCRIHLNQLNFLPSDTSDLLCSLSLTSTHLNLLHRLACAQSSLPNNLGGNRRKPWLIDPGGCEEEMLACGALACLWIYCLPEPKGKSTLECYNSTAAPMQLKHILSRRHNYSTSERQRLCW